MAPAAETIGNQLIDKINDAFSNGQVNDFVIANLKKEATNLIQVDPVEAYTVLGAIECVCGNRDRMIEHHRRALRLSSENVFALTNYSTSLANSWMLDEQYQLLTEMDKKEVAIEQTLFQLGYNRALVGDYAAASVIAQRYLELYGQEQQHGCSQMKMALEADDFIKSNDLDVNEVSEYCSIMNQILIDQGYAPAMIDVWITPEQNLVRDVELEVDDTELSNLNESLFEALAKNQFSDRFYSKFSGCFIYQNSDV
jgi:tetratricopeptide (TPR) repeat protein